MGLGVGLTKGVDDIAEGKRKGVRYEVNNCSLHTFYNSPHSDCDAFGYLERHHVLLP